MSDKQWESIRLSLTIEGEDLKCQLQSYDRRSHHCSRTWGDGESALEFAPGTPESLLTSRCHCTTDMPHNMQLCTDFMLWPCEFKPSARDYLVDASPPPCVTRARSLPRTTWTNTSQRIRDNRACSVPRTSARSVVDNELGCGVVASAFFVIQWYRCSLPFGVVNAPYDQKPVAECRTSKPQSSMR